jgi:hypothetical protein
MVSFITSKTPSRIDEGCSNGLWAGFRISMEQDLPPSYPFSVMRPDQIEASFFIIPCPPTSLAKARLDFFSRFPNRPHSPPGTGR